MTIRRTILALFALSTAILLASGCAPVGVKPWERDIMAKPSMQLDGAAVDRGLDDHIYFSKEASSGGRGLAEAGADAIEKIPLDSQNGSGHVGGAARW